MSNTIIKALAAGSVATGLLLTGCSSAAAPTTAASAGCTPAHAGLSTVAGGKLTVAAPEFAPFASLTGGTPNGIDIEIVQAIAGLECLGTEFVQVEYSAAVPAVQSGRADVAVGDYYRTTSRAEIVGLSDPMYYDGMGIISKDGVTDLPTILTRKVGTVDGYLWVPDLKKVVGDQLKVYKSNVEMWADLKAGRIEIGIDSIPVGELHAKDNPGWQVATAKADTRIGASVKPAQAGLPYTKDNAVLGTALNEDIAKLRASGKLAEIFTAHGVDPDQTDVKDNYLLES
jgi:polar amino acid transport system substrate-binding protein